MQRRLTLLVAGAVLFVPAIALAQTTTPPSRGFFSVGVGGQLTSSDISVREMFPLFQETATVESKHLRCHESCDDARSCVRHSPDESGCPIAHIQGVAI